MVPIGGALQHDAAKMLAGSSVSADHTRAGEGGAA